MIRILNAHDVVTDEVKYVEFAGLSTDEKPFELDGGISISTGSVFIEVDTGNAYMYDELYAEWCQLGNDSVPNADDSVSWK